MKLDWFGWNGRKLFPRGSPNWFIQRGANFLYLSIRGICALTVPWFWVHAAIEARGWDAGWRAGFDVGFKRGQSEGKG